jgi:hypothetical protein
MIFSGKFFLKRKLSGNLPQSLLRGPFREYRPSELSVDGLCVKNGGIEVLWPILEAREVLDDWFQADILDNVIDKAACGDPRSVKKLQSIQALVYRLLDDES